MGNPLLSSAGLRKAKERSMSDKHHQVGHVVRSLNTTLGWVPF